jgi:hypothetical protein
MNESRITELMKSLDLTREEAIQLIQEDEEVDRMTIKQAESDLTKEQKQAIKKARGGAKAVNAYGKKVTVKRKADTSKRKLIDIIFKALQNAECENIEVTNVEREINFKVNDRKFKIILSAPRK